MYYLDQAYRVLMATNTNTGALLDFVIEGCVFKKALVRQVHKASG